MLHIGLLCPPVLGHLNPTLTLGKALSKAGYKVSIIALADICEIAEQYGVNHIPYAVDSMPKGYLKSRKPPSRSISGLDSIKNMMEMGGASISVSFQELPQTIIENGISFMIVDHACIEAPTICDYLQIPFITICNAKVSRFSLNFPPSYYPGKYSRNIIDRTQNLVGYIRYIFASIPATSVISKQRKKWNLKPSNGLKGLYSQLAVICQQTSDLDFPPDDFVENFYYVGPFLDQSDTSCIDNFEFEETRPLIYVTFGTLQNSNLRLYKLISDSLKDTDYNVLIAIGKDLQDEHFGLESSNVIVRSFVDQIAVLKKASLCITHAGMNTVMHCVYTATPMITMPIALEQPGIASIVQHSGSGLMLDLNHLSQTSLIKAVDHVYHDPSYKTTINAFQKNCIEAGGVSKAVQIIERVIKNGLQNKNISKE